MQIYRGQIILKRCSSQIHVYHFPMSAIVSCSLYIGSSLAERLGLGGPENWFDFC